MKFSIIVPVYKTEKYVKQCVDSILAQSFTDFELILVDNESPDNCPQICDDYAKQDSRVRAIHKKHGTAASGRNLGIKSAVGDYLCFLDSDDWWADSEVLAKINARIERTSPDILELYYKFHFDSTGEEMIPNTVDFTGFDELENDKKIEFLINHDRLNPSAWGMCISREFIAKSQGYFDENLVTEDVEWCLRLFSHSPKVDAIQDSLYVYRKDREGSITSNMKAKNVYDYCDVIERAVGSLDYENNLVHKVLMNYVSYLTLIASALTFRKSIKLTKAQKKELRGRLKAYCKKFIAQYQNHPKVKKAVTVYKILGYWGMARVLGFYLNHRGR